jgi:ribosomal protein S18 acetylase RimI-like enzyme
MKFFQNPPAISWFTWLQRRVWSVKENPSLFTVKPMPIMASSIETFPSPAKKTNAKEYSMFLLNNFSTKVQTAVYPEIFENYLDNGLIGVEIRDKSGSLVGTVFSWYCGTLENTQAGIITWLCVRPDMRKMGIADTLLHTIQKTSYPRTIHFFRNDIKKSPSTNLDRYKNLQTEAT